MVYSVSGCGDVAREWKSLVKLWWWSIEIVGHEHCTNFADAERRAERDFEHTFTSSRSRARDGAPVAMVASII
jgi:hypothetical protein